MEDLFLKVHLHLSVEAEVFTRRERGTEQRDQERGLKNSLRAEQHSPFWLDSDGPECVIPVSSSRLHVLLAPRLKASKSPRAGIPEGWSLYLLKLDPRILIQTCYSSTSCTLVRVSTYRNIVKRMVRWVTISHRYNFPLLHNPTVNFSSISMEVRWL